MSPITPPSGTERQGLVCQGSLLPLVTAPESLKDRTPPGIWVINVLPGNQFRDQHWIRQAINDSPVGLFCLSGDQMCLRLAGVCFSLKAITMSGAQLALWRLIVEEAFTGLLLNQKPLHPV